MHNYLSHAELGAALRTPDLSDPATSIAGEPHAVALLLEELLTALGAAWNIPQRVHRLSPLVSTRDNYDRLGYSPAAVTRNSRYSRHVSPTVMLRSHTTAGIPALLDSLAPELGHYDVLHALPGLVFRRDQADKTHVGTPHQVDLWRLRARTPVSVADLHELMEIVVNAVLPGAKWRAVPTGHVYTVHGHQLDVWVDSHWLELAECGLIAAHILRAANLETLRWGGLAMGIGLDRALMLRKGIDDIRLLRSTRADVVAQLHDLKPWRPVTVMPAMRRDLSVLCSAGTDVEVLGDLARTALGASADLLQSLTVLSDTPAEYLAESARQRLQPSPGQHNVLIRLELASLDRTLTAVEANRLRDEVYLAIHQGPVKELIAV